MAFLVYSIMLICLHHYTTGIADQGHHSLWMLTTHILGEPDLPELSAVLMLDDVKLAHYDPDNKRIVYKKDGHQEEKIDPFTHNSMRTVLEDTFRNMQERSSILRKHFNSTEILVQQRITGCELLNNDEGQIMIEDAFSGINGMVLNSNSKQQYDYQTGWSELVFSAGRTLKTQVLFKHVYLPICIKTLKDLLKKEKNIVMRKEKPRIRIFRKMNAESGDESVTCLATGFYPRHIDLSLFRDGQPVVEQELTVGDLLPNGDGTYQLKKALNISARELRENHHYTCTAAHLSLANKLNITLENGTGAESTTVSVILLVVVPLALLMSVFAGFYCWWRRRNAGDGAINSTTDEGTEEAEPSLHGCRSS